MSGVRLAATSAGIYADGRDDLVLFELCDGAGVSAVFTSNRFCAAPVTVARNHLRSGPVRRLLVNAGNANAGVGARGVDDALQLCAALAEQAGCAPQAVLPFSTGVIGEYLPVDKIRRALPRLHDRLAADAWSDCARAIMTTDTRPKGRSVQGAGPGAVTVTGIAKGAGMIKPDMATMLAFIATDAAAPRRVLDRILRTAVQQSFNRICVDGDTSSNDACVLIATGKQRAGGARAETAAAYEQLEGMVTEVCVELARDIVRDAEGATKFVTIRVENARNEDECARVAETVSASPLVKTALYASDPNWGRILVAVGRCGIDDLDVSRVSLYLQDVCVVHNGVRAEDYTEEKGQGAMQHDEITLRIDLNRGGASLCCWTCDLSHDYVTINAEYRT